MPFTSYYSSSAQPSSPHFLSGDERGEESGGTGSGCMAVGSSGADGYDCESEEGVEVLDEPAKPVPPRSSGSKRSRAAEVHNLSERRRRSRINEKMKALQNLIPNSNKMDKASMLDEAIEYLKQLQFQVQMLSMRNGLNLHTMYFPGAMQSLQASGVPSGFGVNDESVMNVDVGMLASNQESSALNSFESLNQCASSHRSLVLPSLANIINLESSFRIDSSQFHSGSFQLAVPSEGIFTEGMAPQQCLDTAHTSRSLQESLFNNNPLETCMLGKERSQDILSKDPYDQVLVQHLHGLQTGRSFPCSNVKTESTEF